MHQSLPAQLQRLRDGGLTAEELAHLGKHEAELRAKGVDSKELLHQLAVRGIQDGLSEMHDVQTQTYIRGFSGSPPIPFEYFDGLRSSKHDTAMSPAQESIILRAFDKVLAAEPKNGASTLTAEMSASLPVASAIFCQRCPSMMDCCRANTRAGATYLMLSVFTGNVDMCRRSLNAGANPNNMAFLRDDSAQTGEMFHGYSPTFMAVLCEQIEILQLLAQRGGAIHVYDRWGRTPLQAAVSVGSTDLVQWLLANGAPRMLGDNSGFASYPRRASVGAPATASGTNTGTSGSSDSAAAGSAPPPLLEWCLAYSRGPIVRPPMDLLISTSVRADSAERRLAAGEDGGATTNGSDPAAPAASAELPPGLSYCHCFSGRLRGYCGCIDDMYMRWSRDRMSADWGGGVDLLALHRKSQSAEAAQRQQLQQAKRAKK